MNTIRIPLNVAMLAGVEITANESMTPEEFCNEVKKLYKKYMPNSNVFVKFETNLAPWIRVVPHVCKSIEECPSKIIHNDPLHVRFSIFLKNIKADTPLPETLVMEVDDKYFTTTPDDKCTYGTHKFPFRKVKGNAKKLLSVLDKYFKTIKFDIKKLLQDNKIHKDHLELVKYKI